MNAKEILADEILRLYGRGGFGRVLKAELDLAVFHYRLVEGLGPRFVQSGRVRYFHVEKSEIYNLSLRLGMTESRFKRLFEEDFFLHREEADVRSFVLDLVNSRSIRERPLKEGRLQLLVPNPVAKKALEERLYSVGGVVEYGNNSELLSVEIFDLLKLVRFTEAAEVGKIIRENILAKARRSESDPDIRAFFAALDKVPLEQKLKSIAQGLAEKLIGRAGDEVVGAVFDFVRKHMEEQ